jgi:hypothetical protein
MYFALSSVFMGRLYWQAACHISPSLSVQLERYILPHHVNNKSCGAYSGFSIAGQVIMNFFKDINLKPRFAFNLSI